jgi:hypothetical protein
VDISVPSGGETAERAAPEPAWVRRLNRLLNSPLLFVCLALATAALAYKWYALEASLRAPDLPGWSWSAHPNTLLIYYPHTDCGCGPGLSALLRQAQAKHFDAAVVTDAKGQSLESIAQEANAFQADLLPSANPKFLRPWLYDGNTTMLRVRGGRVISRAGGTVIPDGF